MIPKNRKTTPRNIQKVVENPIPPDFSKSELPAAYRRLMGLIFISSDTLIHKVPSNDKISS